MIILLTLPRSGSHLLANILKCSPFTSLKPHGEWVEVDEVLKRLKTKEDVWFHYPFNEKLREELQGFPGDRYLLLRDPRDIIVSWAHYCEEPEAGLDFEHKGKYLHEYRFSERVNIIMDYAYDFFQGYEKWRTSGMFIVLRYKDIICNPLAQEEYVGFRHGARRDYKIEMTQDQKFKSAKMYKELIENW